MTEIAFTGDIAFSKHMKDAFAKEDLISPELIDFLKESDYVVPNVEGALTSGTMTRGDKSTPAHASDPRSASWLVKMGGNIWNLSNNHTLDCSEAGLVDTMKLAESYGYRTLGAGLCEDEAKEPVVIDECGGIAMLAVCYKTLFKAGKDKPGIIDWNDMGLIKKAIKDIKKKYRWCILIVHGGEEFSNLPLPFVRKKYLRYLSFGADIIVGHHPHVPQNYETVGEKIIFYSLGNFVFDTDYQRQQRNTEKGVLLKLKLTDDSYSWEHMPYSLDRENVRIVKDECPYVFRNVSKKEYKQISPLAVKVFLDDYRRAKVFLKPYMANYSKLKWAKWYVENKGLRASLSLAFGRFRYAFGRWKKADGKLAQYISGKTEL